MMHQEVGTVIASRGGTARVLVAMNAACDHCPSRSCCTSLGGDLKGVDVSNRMGAREGQKVKVAISQKAVLKASFILYMVPTLALISGAVLGSYLGPQHKEIWAVSMGIGFFAGSYFVIKVLNTYLDHKAEYLPVITGILPEHTSGHDTIY